MTLNTTINVGVEAATPVSVTAFHDTVQIHVGPVPTVLRLYGSAEDVVAFAHRLAAALAPTEAVLLSRPRRSA